MDYIKTNSVGLMDISSLQQQRLLWQLFSQCNNIYWYVIYLLRATILIGMSCISSVQQYLLACHIFPHCNNIYWYVIYFLTATISIGMPCIVFPNKQLMLIQMTDISYLQQQLMLLHIADICLKQEEILPKSWAAVAVADTYPHHFRLNMGMRESA